MWSTFKVLWKRMSELSVTFPIHSHSILNIPRLDLNVIGNNLSSLPFHLVIVRSSFRMSFTCRYNSKNCRWDNTWWLDINNVIALMYARSYIHATIHVRINFLAAQYNSVFSQEIHWPSKHRVVDVYTQFQRVSTSERNFPRVRFVLSILKPDVPPCTQSRWTQTDPKIEAADSEWVRSRCALANCL